MGNLKLRTLRCVFHTGTETSGCYKIRNVLNDVNARGRHVALLCFATEVDYAQQSALPSRLCHFHEQPNGSVLTNASGQAQIILRSSAFRNSPRTVHVQANLRVQVQQHKREVNIETEWVHCACSELRSIYGWESCADTAVRETEWNAEKEVYQAFSHTAPEITSWMTELCCKSECPFTGKISHLRNRVCV